MSKIRITQKGIVSKFKCHKTVIAWKVASVGEADSHVIAYGNEDGNVAQIEKSFLHGMREGFSPSDLLNGYIVQYEDGYVSWSPCDAFENGYTLISERKPNGFLDISIKKEALLAGYKEAASYNAHQLTLLVTTPANDAEIITVIGKENIEKKIDYIESAYNDFLEHNANNKVKITNYKFEMPKFETAKDLFNNL